MAAFKYRAVDQLGAKATGIMEAEDPNHLDRLLLELGYWLIEASPHEREKRRSSAAKVSRRDMIELCSAMSAMLDAGITIVDAMKTMARETPNDAFRWVLGDLSMNIEAGSTLTEAMERHPKVFPSQITNIVKAGEYSGNLGTSFREVMLHLEWVERLVSDLKQVSIYPLVVLFTVSLFVLLLFGFVVPTFAELLAELGMTLPLITRLVISAGDFVKTYWWALIGLPAALTAGYRFGRARSQRFAFAMDSSKLQLPVFGDILRMISLSRLSHNMGMLMRSGVPMLQALELCRELVGNLVVEKAVRQAELAVNDGETISSVFRQFDVFTPMIMRMIVVGEETGTMERSMDHISARFDDEIPRQIKRLMSLLEPMIILSLIGLVGTVALAIFLPFMELLGGIM
ncbi:MAG: type IV pilus assembly protein PilC [Gammaproteobacteria bacterium]